MAPNALMLEKSDKHYFTLMYISQWVRRLQKRNFGSSISPDGRFCCPSEFSGL